jgi:hypothetical protein
MTYPESLARLCDLVLMHGDGRSLAEKTLTVRQIEDYGRLVWVTADESGLGMVPANLPAEKASADALFRETAGWGYVPRTQAQQFPFVYQPAETAEFSDTMSEAERGATYFKAVLEHIASLVLRKPPLTTSKKKR